MLIELENPQLDIPNIVRPVFYISQNSSYFKRHLRMLSFCILENYNIREIVPPGGGRGGAGSRAGSEVYGGRVWAASWEDEGQPGCADKKGEK